MKINLKINELYVDYSFDFDEDSKTFLRPKSEVFTKLVPYNNITLNFIPTKDMTICGNTIESINLVSKSEVDIVLHSTHPNISRVFNRDKFTDYDVEGVLGGNRGDDLARKIYNEVNSFEFDVRKLYRNRVIQYSIDYGGALISSFYLEEYNPEAEHERQKYEMYYAMQKFRLKIDSIIDKCKNERLWYTSALRYINVPPKMQDSKLIKIAMLNRCGIPLNENEEEYLVSKCNETILGRMLVKKTRGW